MQEWRAIAPLLSADFYPLTAHSTDRRDWIAFQHDRPEQGDGVVHVFRRALSPYLSARFQLWGLDLDADYRVCDTDGATPPLEAPGRRLLGEGLPVTLPQRPAAAIFTYRRV